MNEVTEQQEVKKGGGKKLVLISLVLALVGTGGGFLAAKSGALSFGGGDTNATSGRSEKPATAFVPVDPIIVSLGPASANRHLSFRAQLEVPAEHAPEVQRIMPRLVDILNSYLRAVDVREFDAPSGLITLRAQMLRRVQLIAGDGRISDLLVMEFVLN
jgi:flagellar protein FliL